MGVKRNISLNDLYVAIDWLDANEGDDGESDSCKLAADLLRREVAKRELEVAARLVAKKHGVSITRARSAVRKHRAAA